MWCIPPQQNAAFVADMEQVLDVYQQPYDAAHPVVCTPVVCTPVVCTPVVCTPVVCTPVVCTPVVCTDESNKQIIGDVKDALPMQPGQILKQDCNYERKGTCNLFIAFEPATGQRDITVTEHRGKDDWAHYVKKVVDELYPDARAVTLVCDQLNTHNLSSLYATFPAAEAHRIACKLHIVHTPKHGSWLNMAEIEFSALSRQCLDQRFEDQCELEQEVQAWTLVRNQAGTSVIWRFTTTDARSKLASLYPKFCT